MSDSNTGCTKYPCVKVAVDHRSKKYVVFYVTSDDEYLNIPSEELLRAAEKVRLLENKHYREAKGDEIDRIATEILGLEPIEYEE